MKHLIAFLGYNQSRIQHPVYRQFVQASLSRRNAALLFLSRPLEERELVHEVNELKRKEQKPTTPIFHICATLNDPNMGQQVMQTVVLIRRLYDCPSMVYCQLPDLEHCTEAQRKAAWNSLVSINSMVTDYPDVELMYHCFLYTDNTQVSLANFLFDITRQSEVIEEIISNGYLEMARDYGAVMSMSTEFPQVFSSFNATGVNYPDDEIRYYIHQSYLNALMALSRPETNPVSMEQCNEHVDQLLSHLPLSTEQVSLLGDSFINLNPDKNKIWPTAVEFWKSSMLSAIQDLEDTPRDEWLTKLKGSLDVSYQSRYRDMGVEYYYRSEKKKTLDYCNVLLSMLTEDLHSVLISNPYPPETCKDIVRSVVNHLQQLALMFGNKLIESTRQVNEISHQLEQKQHEYDAVGFLDRMRGKDKIIYEEFTHLMSQYYLLRTQCAGSDFATKLLNELIPQVLALSENVDSLGQVCQEAFDITQRYIASNAPSSIHSIFPMQPIIDAAQAIRVDCQKLHEHYHLVLALIHDKHAPLDGEQLLQSVRDLLSDEIDQYIHHRIEDGTLPSVLDINIVDRIESLYSNRGGMKAFVDNLKKETALSLKLKEEGGQNEQYLLIAPECSSLGRHIVTNEVSNLQMIHLLTGISLSDLEGFSGQRMFVEPSIF